MSEAPAAAAIRDNTALARFELDVEGGVAFVTYRRGDGVMTFTHSEVPAAQRGRGLGAVLVRGALEAARAQGVRVSPRCGYVARFMAGHPEFEDMRA